MLEVLTKASGFVAVIVVGWILQKIRLCGERTFRFLSRLITRLTLPASIISGFAGKEIDPSMLMLSALGLGCGVLYMTLGYVTNLRQGKRRQAFDILNLPGYNIGNFALPFTQSFLGPVGVVTTSLFDVGNACIVLGGAYSMAAMVQEGKGFSLKRLLRTLSRSLPFLCYLVMTAIALLRIRLPGPLLTITGAIGSTNAYVAMLMIGVSFKIEANREQLGRIARFLGLRYGVAVVLALVFWFLLPFELPIRQTLTILVFSPFSINGPPFTAELDGDVGLASAYNSIALVISIVIMVVLLTVLL